MNIAALASPRQRTRPRVPSSPMLRSILAQDATLFCYYPNILWASRIEDRRSTLTPPPDLLPPNGTVEKLDLLADLGRTSCKNI